MVFIGDVWYYWKLVAVDDIGGCGSIMVVVVVVLVLVLVILVFILTVVMVIKLWWRSCWQVTWVNGVGVDGNTVGGNDYGVHDASMVPCDNLFTFGAGWEKDHGELMRLKETTCGLGSCEVELWTSPTATHVDKDLEFASSLARRRRMVKELMKRTIIMKCGWSYQRTSKPTN